MNEIPLFDEPTPKRPWEETPNSNMSNLIGSSSVPSIIRSLSFLACSDPRTDRELQTFVFEKYYFYFTDKVGMFHRWVGVPLCMVLELSKRAMLWCLGVFEGRRKASKNILTWSLSKGQTFSQAHIGKQTLKGSGWQGAKVQITPSLDKKAKEWVIMVKENEMDLTAIWKKLFNTKNKKKMISPMPTRL